VITAADTNVLFDILLQDPTHDADSLAALRRSAAAGRVVIGEVVFAELAAGIPDVADVNSFLREIGVGLVTSAPEALIQAGKAWRSYTGRGRRGVACADCGTLNRPSCRKCGVSIQGKQHLLADFLIGGHAVVHADRLLTRDRRHFARYFPQLPLTYP
jgi:predicted nucleic acid-binding protein